MAEYQRAKKPNIHVRDHEIVEDLVPFVAQMRHKHMQAIPIESLVNQQGIFSIVNDESGLDCIDDQVPEQEQVLDTIPLYNYSTFVVKAFPFKHVLVKFNQKLPISFDSFPFQN